MRKSIDGLCAIILDQLKVEPDGRSIYLFCGKRCDRIKVLLREPDGYVLLYKRLHVVQGRYRWPRNKSEVKAITWQQFDWLMSGLEIEQPKALQAVSRLTCSLREHPKPLILLAFLPFSWYTYYSRSRSRKRGKQWFRYPA